MAITFYRSGYLRTLTANVPDVDRISLSLFLRLNNLNTAGMFHDVFSGGGVRIYCNGASTTTQQTTLYAQASPTSGTLTASKTKFSAGPTYHLAIVYDRFDPTRQFLAVNGVKYPFPTTSASAVSGSGVRYWFGNNGSTILDHSAEHVLVTRGHAFSDEDVEALMDDPASAANFEGVAGTDRVYWSCQGPIGQDVALGDPGLSTPGVPSESFSELLGLTDGASIAYSADLGFLRAASAGTPYVRSSGRSICVPFVNSITGDGLAALAGGLSSVPTVRIDGGEPIQLPGVVEGAYVNDNTTAAFFPLPEGVTIEPGQAVTMSVSDDWLVTEFGRLPAMDGVTVDNRAGRPSSSPVWPEPDPLRPGININAAAIYYAVRQWIPRNLAHLADPPEASLYMGKAGGNGSQRIIQMDGNSVDKTGAPLILGLYAVRWDDDVPSSPTTISLVVGTTSFTVTEKTAYRNNGDAEGRGKVRVFDVQKATASPTLAAAIDATTTSVRLTGTISGWMSSVSDRDAYVEFGSEKIKLGTRVGSTDEFAGCERGYDGTTPTPHEAGAAGFATTSANFGYIMIKYENAAGVVRYSNLAVLSPGNWTVPESPRTVSIPPVAWDELDGVFLEKFRGGMGVMRFMDSTPTFYTCQEPEHVSAKDAPHWGAPLYADQLRFATIRPFDPAASPYIYSHFSTPGLNAETYPATLTTPLDAGEPRSEVVASLTTAEGDHLCYGTRLMRGGETLRIKALLGGGSYLLVRGVDGTTPVAHPAGPMTAGWRIPLLAESRWKWPGTSGREPHRYFEAILEPGTSSPPRLGYIASGTFGVDANVTARRSLTFPDGIGAAAVEFAATPADPGDWYYLANGLQLVVAGEVMTIVSASQESGTVVVAARTAGPAYAAGTTGVTRTDKMLWRNADDTARLYKAPIYAYSIVRPTGPWSYLASTSISSGEGAFTFPAGVQQFDPALAATVREVFPRAFLPYAMIGTICSLGTGGKPTWPWVNIPTTASDDLIRHIFREVRDNLSVVPGRRVIVEFGNEVWNQGVFKFYAMNFAMDALMGRPSSSYTDWWMLRQDQAVGIAREVFGEHGRADEIKSVLAWQTGLIGNRLADARRLGIEHDYVSMAPYLATPSTDDYTRTFNACDDAQAGDLFATAVEFANDGVMLRKVAIPHKKAVAEHATLTGKSIPTIYYEGDLEYVVPQHGLAIDTSARARDIVFHPNYYNVQREIFDIFRRVGDCEAFAVYCHAIGGGGVRPRQWGMFTHPHQRWGYGDGRDGTVDNRLTRFRTAGPLDSPEATNVSVRFQALLDANQAFLENGETPPATPSYKGYIGVFRHYYGVWEPPHDHSQIIDVGLGDD